MKFERGNVPSRYLTVSYSDLRGKKSDTQRLKSLLDDVSSMEADSLIINYAD